ncbi:hypothetical protein Tco_1339705 [Tanacetum coccineum]
MSTPKFADSHNMVTLLAKPTESDRFEKILDFLNANPIKYTLTVNPTIYISCIEQFWATAKTSVRRDLQLEDAKGIECLPNADIFEQLALMGKDTEIPQSSGPTEPIADEAANVPTQSNDLPLSRVNTLGSGDDSLTLKELIDLCTKLSDRVLDLETTKTAQANEIASLKKRVKKLERKRKSKTPEMKRVFKIGRSAQVVSSEDEDVFNGEEVFVVEQSEKVVEDLVSTAEVSAAATITTEEITSLVELRSVKPKVVVQEPVQKQAGLAREKAEKVEEANSSWDNVQAMIEADRLLAERLQTREQEELTDEEKARLFVELLEKKKKHFATLRAQEKKNKPPIKA